MIGQLVFHIGDPKTGTSSIQTVLHGARWSAPGLSLAYYPGRNALPLANALMATGRGFGRKLTRQQNLVMRQWILDSEAAFGVVSAEQFSGVDPQLLRDFLVQAAPDHLADARVVAYVRPHLARFVSAFAQRTKTGIMLDDPATFFDALKERKGLHYAPRFRQWREVFGDRFELRVMDRARLHRGDMVQDFFCTVTGRTDVEITGETFVNESVSLPVLLALREVQRVLDTEGTPRTVRDSLGGWIATEANRRAASNAPRLVLDRALARRIAETYRADAETLDDLFFADRPISAALDPEGPGYTESPPRYDPAAFYPAEAILELQQAARDLAAAAEAAGEAPPALMKRAWRFGDRDEAEGDPERDEGAEASPEPEGPVFSADDGMAALAVQVDRIARTAAAGAIAPQR